MSIQPCGYNPINYEFRSEENEQHKGIPKPKSEEMKRVYSIDDTPKVKQKGMMVITVEEARDF